MRPVIAALVFAVGLAPSGPTVLPNPRATAGFKTFVGHKSGFAVDYPESWYVVPDATGWGGLEIHNFPPSRAVEGVILPPRGASIAVFTAPPGAASVESFASSQLAGDRDVNETQASGEASYPGGCSSFLRATALYEVGPGRFQRITTFYCSIARRPVAVELLTWRGDPGLPRLRDLAFRMALSLRPPGGNAETLGE